MSLRNQLRPDQPNTATALPAAGPSTQSRQTSGTGSTKAHGAGEEQFQNTALAGRAGPAGGGRLWPVFVCTRLRYVALLQREKASCCTQSSSRSSEEPPPCYYCTLPGDNRRTPHSHQTTVTPQPVRSTRESTSLGRPDGLCTERLAGLWP